MRAHTLAGATNIHDAIGRGVSKERVIGRGWQMGSKAGDTLKEGDKRVRRPCMEGKALACHPARTPGHHTVT